MTTALIGNPGATAVKAHVAVVGREHNRELIDLLHRSGHDSKQFADWAQFSAPDTPVPSWDLVLYDDRAADDVPDTLDVPAILVSDRSPGERGPQLGTVAAGMLEQSLDALLAMAVELRSQTARRLELEQLVDGLNSGEAIVGRCPVMRRVQSSISRAADCDATVLIEGPTGSGKSLAARMIHCKSRRAGKPMRVGACATIDANTMTSLLDDARGTTLLLEGIDQLAGAAQSALVKHLKERSGPRAEGATRLVVTTAAHLPELIAKGAFREDLYYRLHAFPMVMPSLREHIDDVREIAQSILMRASAQTGRAPHSLTPAAVILLENMSWPNNVTQLEAVVRRAHVLAAGATIDREHITAASAPGPVAGSPAVVCREQTSQDGEVCEDDIRPFEQEEQALLSRALRATKGNVRRAAQLLGIGRATLYRKIQQYKLRLQ